TDTGSRIRVAVSWSGPMDLNEVLRDGRSREQDIVREFLNCPTGPCDPMATEASPVTYVDGSDGALFVANGSQEKIPWPQAAEMSQALRSARVPDQLVEVPGTMHSRAYENVSVTSNGKRETVLQAS